MLKDEAFGGGSAGSSKLSFRVSRLERPWGPPCRSQCTFQGCLVAGQLGMVTSVRGRLQEGLAAGPPRPPCLGIGFCSAPLLFHCRAFAQRGGAKCAACRWKCTAVCTEAALCAGS